MNNNKTNFLIINKNYVDNVENAKTFLKKLKNFKKAIAFSFLLYYNLIEVEKSGVKCHKVKRM